MRSKLTGELIYCVITQENSSVILREHVRRAYNDKKEKVYIDLIMKSNYSEPRNVRIAFEAIELLSSV